MSHDNPLNFQAMIASVGGSVEPLIVTLQQHRPELVIFFASEQTVELIGTIKDRLREGGDLPMDRKVVTREPENLVTCYADALECTALVEAVGVPAARVAVDFTGGTKVMSAALTLATVGKGFSFAYVGGRERSKGGRGVVVTGSEAIVHRDDPFAVYAVEERKRLAVFFRTFQFTAAQTLIRSLVARPLRNPDRLAFELVGEVAQGYILWERLEYGEALRVLGRCHGKWSIATQANPGIHYADVLPALEANVRWLERLAKQTAGFTRYHTLLVADLVANADRRASEGSYDDGIVRLYRALELGAQAAIQRHLGCGTDRVPVTAIPEEVRSAFLSRYREDDPGFLRLPLEASYRLLAALNEGEGRQFEQQRVRFKKVQSARNSSWLGHGMNSGSEAAYHNLRGVVVEILGDQPPIPFVNLEDS
jgi:CRISPR-associated protein (TIGR02710 family)